MRKTVMNPEILRGVKAVTMSEYREEKIPEEEKIDLIRIINDMWKGLKHYGVIFILLAVVLSGVFYLKAYRSYSPVYTSSATFTITSDTSSSTISSYSSYSYQDQKSAELIVKTFSYILNSDLFQKAITEELGTTGIPGSIWTETVGSTNLITITVTSGNYDDSYDILCAVIEHYPAAAEPVIGDIAMNLLDISDEPVNTAVMPSIKSSIVKGTSIAIAAVCAFLLLYAVTRTTIREEKDLKKYFNIECICSIPQITFKKRSKKNRNDISIYNTKISPSFLETIRVLRIRIEKDARKNNRKVFLVTSAAPGEGKSTIAANAAMALAMNGSKVILIDCDLRNPSVRTNLNLEKNGPGLYEVLCEKAQLKDVLVWNETYKMHILPGGKPYNNASELLDSYRMKKIMEQLKEDADYIIMDTAPVGMLTDTAVLAQSADTALFVVKQDYAKASNIMEGIAQLAESHVHISGCVLNGVKAGIGGYGYKYYQYYNRYGNYREGSRYGKEE